MIAKRSSFIKLRIELIHWYTGMDISSLEYIFTSNSDNLVQSLVLSNTFSISFGIFNIVLPIYGSNYISSFNIKLYPF